jgi:hypothetical protein
MNTPDLVYFWGAEPVQAITSQEIEILQKTEKRIVKTGKTDPCFIHSTYVQFEKRRIYVRYFVFGIFVGALTYRKKIYLRCNEKTCVNPLPLTEKNEVML